MTLKCRCKRDVESVDWFPESQRGPHTYSDAQYLLLEGNESLLK